MTHRYLQPTWWVRRLVPNLERWVDPAQLMPVLAWAGRVGGEPELRRLPDLARPDRLAVDVGAADGVYAWHLVRSAAGCVAFEANPESAARVQARVPRAIVHPIALSHDTGTTELRVPVVDGVAYTGLATVEAANRLTGFVSSRVIEVPVRTLDSFELLPVGFIKIDVEGHELAVLEGARATILRDRPVLLVEVEERHRPGALSSVTDFLRELGYAPAEPCASAQNHLFRPDREALC